MGAVRIPPQGDGWLGFDLAEVMSAVGQSDNLQWVLRWASFNGDVSAVWPDGIDSVEARTRLPEGVPMTWAEMWRLAAACSQIIDGEFSGYQETQLRLRLGVIDSSYWVVTADDPQVLARVRSTFKGVTTSDPT
jgi:hypothetical protein